MQKTLLFIFAFLATITTAKAIEDNTVEIVYNGNSATITIAPNISSYVTVSSGTSSHVKLVQKADFAGVNATVDNEDGEIIYVLSGTSDDGEFYMAGAFKATVELNGLTLTNPSGPAINLQNGKRTSVSVKKDTNNKLVDGVNDTYNGCFHCKGHTKFKGKGTLSVVGNSKHAIYSKEYIEVKNCTIQILAAAKDAIHCKEYFLQESGTINITSAADDGIQVELDGTTSTGITTGHEDEDTGNFYQTSGNLTISSFGDKAIKADGSVSLKAGKYFGFTLSDVSENNYSSICLTPADANGNQPVAIYDLRGHHLSSAKALTPGLYIVKRDGKAVKTFVK
jgi:hypothetical protein